MWDLSTRSAAKFSGHTAPVLAIAPLGVPSWATTGAAAAAHATTASTSRRRPATATQRRQRRRRPSAQGRSRRSATQSRQSMPGRQSRFVVSASAGDHSSCATVRCAGVWLLTLSMLCALLLAYLQTTLCACGSGLDARLRRCSSLLDTSAVCVRCVCWNPSAPAL